MTLVYSGISPAEFDRKRLSKSEPDTHVRQLIREAKTRINKVIPSTWRAVVNDIGATNWGSWLANDEALRRMTEFEKENAGALGWNLSDDEICKKAIRCADETTELLTDILPSGARRAVVLTETEKLEAVLLMCKLVGVDTPEALTVAGAIARGCSEAWWRRRIRKKVARVVEHGAIKLGLVNRYRGGYASNDAVKRRAEQLARNEAILKNSLIRNEAGQVYTLFELAALSVSNRDNRRGELMTRIRGCEEYADSLGHGALFFTMTAPSKFHAVTFDHHGRLRPNRHYGKLEGDDLDCSPRGAQVWIRTMWARSRAEMARQGVKIYGFRVAEPHHDGTPHWHALFWFKSDADAAKAKAIISDTFLSEYGDENGATEHRVKCVAIDRKRGSAAGYIAKYITKNVGADFDIETPSKSTKSEYTYKRVDAWAATWGIRQFQSIGLPSVTVWRCLRGVDNAQVDLARVAGDYLTNKPAWQAYANVHKRGDVQACFKGFMMAMGGVCVSRSAWALQVAKRVNKSVNGYGETFAKKVAVGVVMPSGAWLISKRVAWARVVDESVPESVEGKSERALLAAPWTGFNNCTARLTGELRRQLFGSHLTAGGDRRVLYDTFDIEPPPARR